MPITFGDAIVYIRGDKTPLAEDLGQAKQDVQEAMGGIQGTADQMGQAIAEGFQAGAEGADDVVEAAGEAEEALGDVGTSAEEAGKTAGSAFSGLKESFQSFNQGVGMVRQALGMVQQVIGTIQQGAQRFRGELSKMAADGDRSAQQLEQTFGNLRTSIDEVGTAAKRAFMSEAIGPMNTFYTGLWGMVEGVKGVSGAFKDTTGPVGNFGSAISNLVLTTGPGAAAQQNLALATGEAAAAARGAALDHAALRLALDEERQAAENAALAQIGGVRALQEYGTQYDQIASQAAEAGQLTQDQAWQMADALWGAAEAAEGLGSAVPLDQVLDLRGKAADLTTALGTMDVPPAIKEALLSYLGMINDELAAAESRARNAAAAMAGISPGAGGGAAAGGEPIANAAGGTLWEPVVGTGQESGRTYIMGEAGPESIQPLTRSPRSGILGNGGINFNFFGPLYAQSPEQARARGADMAYTLRMSLRAGGVT